MSDSLPQPEPDETPPPSEVPAESVPNSPEAKDADEVADATEATDEAEEISVPDDPAALAADRAGFKFLAIGFVIFFILIAVCAGVVAIVMKNMGI